MEGYPRHGCPTVDPESKITRLYDRHIAPEQRALPLILKGSQASATHLGGGGAPLRTASITVGCRTSSPNQWLQTSTLLRFAGSGVRFGLPKSLLLDATTNLWLARPAAVNP